ncbi:MAG: hypothetical protein ACTHM6_03945 [Tepidisphaeraceae bacterium]
MKGLKIGEILIEQKVLTRAQVDHLLKIQKSVGRPFGDLAERLYGIDPQVVQHAWVEQYASMVGLIDIDRLPVEADCLDLVNRRQAWQFHLVPLNRQDDQLNVVTTADALVRSVNFATRRFNEPTYFMLVDHEHMNDLLMKHYPVPKFIAQYAESL